MIIKQISVFLENRPGTLAEALSVLQEHGINLRAMSVADTADFGILRLIVNEPDKVERVLRGGNFPVKTNDVLALTVADKPGGLLEQVKKLTAAGINIEYVYAFAASANSEARVVLKVDDLERAERLVNGEKRSESVEREGQGPNFYW